MLCQYQRQYQTLGTSVITTQCPLPSLGASYTQLNTAKRQEIRNAFNPTFTKGQDGRGRGEGGMGKPRKGLFMWEGVKYNLQL